MKQKTSKLRKLERERYSILTEDMENCYICKMTANDIHEVYCGSKRQASMRNGFCVPLCRFCHTQVTNNWVADVRLRVECQRKFEENHTRDEFISIVGKNYL